MASRITLESEFFTDKNGQPLDNGYVYIGEPNLNPETSTKQVYWDQALSIPATQPIRTEKGRTVRFGVPTDVYTDGIFSITTRDSSRKIVSSKSVSGNEQVNVVTFASRDDFVLSVDAGYSASDGAIASDGTVQYVASAGATAISDLPGWLPFGRVTPQHFGAFANGVANDFPGIQAAINYAGTTIDPDAALPLVSATVYFPRGVYNVPSGSTVIIPRGVLIDGEGRSAVRVNHGGGGVRCFSLTDSETSNTNVTISNMEIKGTSTTTAGVFAFGNFKNGLFENLTIRDCFINLSVRRCWTLRVVGCNILDAADTNVYADSVTTAVFEHNRIDNAAVNNVYVTGGGDDPTTDGVKFIGGYYQFAGRAGIRLQDVSSCSMFQPYFEGNNTDGVSSADIEWIHGTNTLGRDLSIFGATFVGSGAGAGAQMVRAEVAGKLSMFGVQSFIGNASEYVTGVSLGSSMQECEIIGGRLDAATAVTRASTNTKLTYTEGGIDALGTSSRTTSAASNLIWSFDAPANARNELRFLSAGALRWILGGRGDSDEGYPDDFYLSSVSGAVNPEFRVQRSTGATFIKPPGPYADDAAAAAGGVIVGQMYRVTGGSIAWRQV